MPTKRTGAQPEPPHEPCTSGAHESTSPSAATHREHVQASSHQQSTGTVASSSTAISTQQSPVIAQEPGATYLERAAFLPSGAVLVPLQQVQCFVCGSHLSYRPGSAWILCPGCLMVLNLQPLLDPRAFAGFTVCPGCQFMIYFPLDSGRTTCAYCSLSIEVTPPQQISCAVCRACLLYNAPSASPIMCLVCQTVMQPDGQPIQSPYVSQQAAPGAAPGPTGLVAPLGASTGVQPLQAAAASQMSPFGALPYQPQPIASHLETPTPFMSQRLTRATQPATHEQFQVSGAGVPGGASVRTYRRRAGFQPSAGAAVGRTSTLVPSSALRSTEHEHSGRGGRPVSPSAVRHAELTAEAPTETSSEQPRTVPARSALTSPAVETSATTESTGFPQRQAVSTLPTRGTSNSNESASSGTSAASAVSPPSIAPAS